MASSFDDLALQYVVLDDEVVMRDLAQQAAKAIEDAGASRIAVGNWAASIKLWIAPGLSSQNTSQRGDGESGNAITRAKAIGFLAATLEVLNKDLLKADQVDLLIGFFGSMFSNDHKAGITPATKALQQLATAKNFEPEMGVKIIEEVSKMKEDFRLQTAVTRLEVYQLVLHLAQDWTICEELQHKYGASCGFIIDLLAMCQHERDPKNLLVWFKIISLMINQYSPSDEVVREIFKAFANYFPITLRESTTPIGVTPEDLKLALRQCFSSNSRLARLTFPYLIQRLDQGDSMKVTVKNDILMTMKAGIEKYENPHVSVTPYISLIWNSLKYEVRNGDVAETVASATLVLRSIGVRFQHDAPQLDEYVRMVFEDSFDDLSDPKYARQAGQLCLAVISSGPQAFVSHSPKLVDSVIQQIPQFSSATYVAYTGDLLEVLQSILAARQALVRLHPDHETLLAAKSATHFQNLFHKVYLPVWQRNVVNEGGAELNVLRAITRGVSELVRQQIVLPGGKKALLCSADVCHEICSLFTHRLLMPLTLSPRDAATMDADVDIGLHEALCSVVTHHIEGFKTLVTATTEAIHDRDWKNTRTIFIDHLWQVLSRVSFIGCAELPNEIALTSATKKYSSLHHFMTWTGALLQLLESFLADGADPRVVKLMVAGLHHSMCSMRDAFGYETKQLNLVSDAGDSLDWAQEFTKVTAGVEIPTEWLRLLLTCYPDIHALVWPIKTDGTRDIPASNEENQIGFTRLSLFIIRHLVRRFTKQSEDSDGKQVLCLVDEIAQHPVKARKAILEQIERMAPMTIQVLDAPSQRFFQLSTEGFRLFSDCEPAAPFWSVNLQEDGALNLLTLSILTALWPDAMTDLYQPNGIAQSILCDTTYTVSANISQTQAWIVAILVNKFKKMPATINLEDVVQFWQARLEQNLSLYGGDQNTELGIDIERLLAFLVGGICRQEKGIIPLIPLAHKVISLPNDVGWVLASEIDGAFDDNVYLQVRYHAVVRPLYKQWAYHNFVKPMYALAVPVPYADSSEWGPVNKPAEHHTLALLSILKRCPYAIWESDVEPLVTLCTTSLKNWHRLSHIEAALHVLLEIMRHDPQSLRYHLRAIITSLTQVYRNNVKARKKEFGAGPDPRRLYVRELAAPEYQNEPVPPSVPEEVPDRSYKTATNAACRKMVLQILGEMPSRFEDRYLMPFKGDMIVFIDGCCGDPVRELRRVAVEAKEGWFGR